MKLRMHERSLFALLLRSPWWLSLAIAAAAFAAVRLAIPALYAAFLALPFVVVAAVAGWRQLRAPRPGQVAAALEALRALPAGDFAAALEQGFRRQGYAVAPAPAAAADLELTRAERLSLVAFRRWKAARTGIEPLRELRAAGRARGAEACLYVLGGEITDTAREFAAREGIRLLQGDELAKLAAR